MMNRLPYCVLLLIVSISACRRNSEPPPRVVSSELGLMPVRVSDVVVDAALLGSAATEESARAAASAQPAAVQVDDATPEGLAKSYVDLINAGQVQQLATFLTAEQQPAATELAPVIQPLLEANAKLHRLLAEKFTGHAFQIGLNHELLPPDWLRRWTVTGVTPDAADENTASAALQEEGGTQTATKALKKVDERWRIEEIGLPPAGTAAQTGAALTPLADALVVVIARIESNELTDAQQVEAEIKQALTGTEPAPAAAAPAEPPAEDAPAAIPAAEPAKKPRERDAVDDTIAVPGVLNRGS